MEDTTDMSKTINFSLLNSWSSELSWFLGLTYGDGNVYRNIKGGDYRVSIVCNLDTVNKWRTLICEDASMVQKCDKAWECYIHSKELVEWFASRGIVGEKSSTLQWPPYMPADNELYRHFIRGLIDTDGSVNIENRRKRKANGNNTLIFSFTAQNRSFVERVHKEIIRLADVEPNQIIENHKTADNKEYVWYCLKYTGAPARKICDWLYLNVPPTIRGESRYQTYAAYVETVAARICSCGQPGWSEDLCQTCWWSKRTIENPKSPCSKNCGKLEYSKGMCLNCYKKEKRSADPKYGSSKTGICGCGVTAVLRKNMCTACYMRNRRAEAKIRRNICSE